MPSAAVTTNVKLVDEFALSANGEDASPSPTETLLILTVAFGSAVVGVKLNELTDFLTVTLMTQNPPTSAPVTLSPVFTVRLVNAVLLDGALTVKYPEV